MNHLDQPLPPHPLSEAPAPQPETAPQPTSGFASARWLAPGLLAAAALEACGGGGDSTGNTASADAAVTAPAARSQSAVPISAAGAKAVAATTFAGGAAGPLGVVRTYAMPANANDAARFLLQCQFNASDSDIALVQSLGYAGFLAQQFNIVPVNTAWAWLNQQGYGVLDARNFHFTPYQTDFAVWNQIFTTTANVRARLTLALSEIFSVSTNGVDYYWVSHLMANWWDALSAGSLGTFRALLQKVTLHPAMGMYLNTRGSQKEDGTGREPDENYAREVMQLMTIGLVQLNADGSPITSGGVPVPTYNQNDVTNLARVFSGYDFNLTGTTYTWFNGLPVPSSLYTRLPMALNPALHSTLDASFLGTDIPAGTAGDAALTQALDTLSNHANVGPFIGRQLIQRLVTSNPSAAYVARVSATFANNGKGVRGDLAATMAAVLLDDEARGPAGLTSNTYGHLREPMVRLAQWGRTFGLNSAYGTWKVYDQSLTTQMAQSPMRSPSIFNFFRPGYVPPGTAIATAGLVAPEFQIVNESTVASYINYLYTVLRAGIYIGAPDKPEVTNDASDGFDLAASYANELPLASDATALVNRFNLLMAGGQLSASTVTVIVNALNATPLTDSSPVNLKLDRIAAGLLMVMSSSEYLVQK